MKLVVIVLLCVLLSGCTVLWTDELFYFDCFKRKSLESALIVAEPNSLHIELNNYVSKPQKVKARYGFMSAETE